jgi:hypothetical protein
LTTSAIFRLDAGTHRVHVALDAPLELESLPGALRLLSP